MESRRDNNYGIDILRIFAMIWIISHHLNKPVLSDLCNGDGPLWNFIISVLLFMGGDIGNVIFIIITGYFMVDKSITFSKWFRLWSCLFFYSIISYLVACMFGTQILSYNSILSALLPIRNNQYWFISAYLIIYFLFPIFNILVNTIQLKQWLWIEIIGLFTFSLLPYLSYNLLNESMPYVLFSILYIFGAGLHRFGLNLIKKAFHGVMAASILIIVSIMIAVLLRMANAYALRFVWGMSLVNVIIGVTLFEIFRNCAVNEKVKGIAKVMGKATFGIYLFHNGYLLDLIIDICEVNKDKYYSSFLWGGYLVGSSVIIFIFGCLIEILRMKFEKIYMRSLERWLNKVDNIIIMWSDFR